MDYGLIHGFWCFGFERFNGILGSHPQNNRDVSITMMKKVRDEIELDLNIGNSELQTFLSEMSFAQKTAGSLRESVSSATATYILQPSLSELLVSLYVTLYGETLGNLNDYC